MHQKMDKKPKPGNGKAKPKTRSERTSKEPTLKDRKDRKAESIGEGPQSVETNNKPSTAADQGTPADAVAQAKAIAVRLQLPEKPQPPVLKQVVTNDVTTEKLAVIMSRNPRGIIRATDELSAFIRMMNVYHGGRGADRQFYLSCWSGSSAQVDRKSEDTPILVKDPFVNVLGGIQPDMLSTLEDERGREDGFIHRFLFCLPSALGRRNWEKSAGVSRQIRQTWNTIIDWLFDLSMTEPDGSDGERDPQPRTLRFSDEAAVVWSNWHERHWAETEWDCFPAHLRGVWSKFEVHALALVLLAQMLKVACEHALTGKPYQQEDPPIDADSMQRGLKLADYFKDHCVRVFNRLKVSHADLKAEHVIKWIRRRPGKRTTAREMLMHGIVGIKTASEAKALLKDLQDRGWGAIEVVRGKSGRKSECFLAA